MFTLTIKSLLALASAVNLAIMPPEPKVINIAYASPKSTLASSALVVDIVPEIPPFKIVQGAFEGKNNKRDEEGDESASGGIVELKNDSVAGIKGLIKQYFPKEPLMVKIADCESIGLRHYVNGEVLRGEIVKEDVGLFQINETYWLKKSLELGIDIYDLEGNIKMARHIYDTQGLSAWSASFKNCWKHL